VDGWWMRNPSSLSPQARHPFQSDQSSDQHWRFVSHAGDATRLVHNMANQAPPGSGFSGCLWVVVPRHARLDWKFSGTLTCDRPVVKPPELLDNRQGGQPSTFLIGTDHNGRVGPRRTIHPVRTLRARVFRSFLYYSWNLVMQASTTTLFFPSGGQDGESSSHRCQGGCWRRRCPSAQR